MSYTRATWRKSSRSGGDNNGQCVEVSRSAAHAAIRDSKNPDGGQLALPPHQLDRMIAGVKAGRMDH